MQQNNPMQMIQQIRSNPYQFLLNKGLNIPQTMSNPQDIVNHLMKSGQVSQQQYNNAVQMMQNFKR